MTLARTLLACMRATPDPGLSPVADWPALLAAAEYHGLASLLCHWPGLAAAPAPASAGFRDAWLESSHRSLFLTASLIQLLDEFEAAGIPVVPLKGPTLAEVLYPDPALRPFSDLDLLIRPPYVPAAIEILMREGYKLAPHLRRLAHREFRRLGGELILRSPARGQVDLKWDTAPPDYPFRFPAEVLWRSVGTAPLAGRKVPALLPECLMLFLCVHGAKHMWSRLMWLGDVDRLARADVDWKVVMALASETRCRRPVLLGLLLARDLLDTPVPDGILEGARTDRTVLTHARQVIARLDSAEPSEPSSFELTAFNASLAEHRWQKIRHYAALMKAPTEAELEWVALPSQLFLLYYPLRAARLVWKYILRLRRRR